MPRRIPHQHFNAEIKTCILPSAQCAEPTTKSPTSTPPKSASVKESVPLVQLALDLLLSTCCVLVIAAGLLLLKHQMAITSLTTVINNAVDTGLFVLVLWLAMIAYRKIHGIKIP